MTWSPKKWYNDYYKSKKRRGYNKYAYIRYTKALKHTSIQTGMNVLDIGCAFGTLYIIIHEKKIKCNYCCADIIDKEMIDLPKNENYRYLQRDITKGIEIEANWADRIFCLEVIEHVREPMAVMEEISRILKSDGLGVISVPNPYFYDTIFCNLLGNGKPIPGK